MIVMIEASTHTIKRLWIKARALAQGDVGDREYGAGMHQVLRDLGAIEPPGETVVGDVRPSNPSAELTGDVLNTKALEAGQ